MSQSSYDTIAAPLKWHGGKGPMASKLVSLMPSHTHYVEPYAGGLAVLLAKDPNGVSEVVNDLNPWVGNFWSVLRHPAQFEAFRRRVEAMPFSQAAWEAAERKMERQPDVRAHDPVVAATMFFVRCRQSLAGRMDTFAPLSRNRTRRGMNEQASAWITAVDGLPAVHARLRRVVTLNGPAVDVIRQQDGPHTLFYCDPPYLHETRASTDVYGPFEMTSADHLALLRTIKNCQGKVMLSGYDSEMYRQELDGWTRHAFDVANNAAGGKIKQRKTEIVWCNF